MTRCQPRRLALFVILAFCCCPPPVSDAEEFDKEGLEFFEQRIRPLLVDRCYKCHSEKAETVQADLYVDTRAGLLKGGDQGPAIEPGEPSRSLLIKAVKYEMDDLKMPPDRRLEDQQIADLEKWIKIGAPDPRKPGKKSITGHSTCDVGAVPNGVPCRPSLASLAPNVKRPG